MESKACIERKKSPQGQDILERKTETAAPVRTSLVLVLCSEYTVRAFLIAIVTNSESIPEFRVPKGGFMRTVSKPKESGGGRDRERRG